MRGSDNKYVANLNVEFDSPWIFAKSDYLQNCFLWKDILFHEIVEKNLPRERWFAPLGCMECYKVVVRPKTLKQLFALERLQKRLDLPSKCGIEIRPEVFGNFGGYFYNRGLEQGLNCYKKVRAEVNKVSILGKDIKVILKRACTEIEYGIGPSDRWIPSKEQIDFEVNLTNRFVNDIPVLSQSDHVKDDIRQRWIEYAWSIGDETVLEYNDGKPLYPEYVTYHHLINKKPKKVKGS